MRHGRKVLSLLLQRKVRLPAVSRRRVQVPLLRQRQLPVPRELPELRLLLMKFTLLSLALLANVQAGLALSLAVGDEDEPPTAVPT